MPPAFLLAVAGLAAGLACQTRPERTPAGQPGEEAAADRSELLFTWQGLVDGRDIIKFRGDSFTIEHESKLPIRDIWFTSRQPLREDHFPVRLKKLAGRGNVDILRQGDGFNHYSLVVRVDDRHIGGAGHYQFAAYASRPSVRDAAVLSVHVEVEQEAVLEVSGFEVRPSVSQADGMGSLKYAFPLGQPVDPAGRYRLKTIRGRGTVRLSALSSPRECLRIFVSDPGPGKSTYILELFPD